MSDSYLVSPYIYYAENRKNKNIIINNFLWNHKQIIDIEMAEFLQFCREFREEDDLYDTFGQARTNEAKDKLLILRKDKVWHPFVFENAEIEISTMCNYKCQYCPVSIQPKTPQVMELENFQKIIEKIAISSNIKNVSFSSYNEPLLDPYFKERLQFIRNYGLQLILHTNGSKLDRPMVDFLTTCGNINEIHINFPIYDAERYAKITGRNYFDHVCENIEYAIDAGLNINFSIQKIGQTDKSNLLRMNQLYAERIGKKIAAWNTVDRAGLLKNDYYQGIYVPDLLCGCKNILSWLTIDVKGNCFLCCNDYFTDYKYGNILEQDLESIINSQQYAELVKMIFGAENADETFICRRCYEMKLMHTYKRLEQQIKKSLGIPL